MKILFIDDDDSIRQLHVMLLDNLFEEVEIVECANGSDSIAKLKNDTFDLIICDYDMPEGTGADVYNFFKHTDRPIPFVLFTTKRLESLDDFFGFSETDDKKVYLNKSQGIPSFKKTISRVAEMGQMGVALGPRDFMRIRIHYFWRFNKSLCDIFVRLSNDKFVKIIKKNDNYTRNDIDKYINKNQKFLHIKIEDYESFSASIISTPFLIYDKDAMKHENREDVIKTTHAIVHELVKSVGVSELAINLASECSSETVKIAKKTDELYSLIIGARNKKDYIYDHSYLLSCIACDICKKMNWSTDQTMKKLSYAAIFHDLCLTDPDLAMIDNLSDPLLQNYSEDQQKAFQNHPIKMAEMISRCPDIPPDVDSIIAQHHEDVTGDGFPRKLSHLRISPLACVFIIAHSFVNELYKCNFDHNQIPEILAKLKNKYSKGNFKEPMVRFMDSMCL